MGPARLGSCESIDSRWFRFYVYPEGSSGKESFDDARSVVVSDDERESLKTVDFRFPRELKPGTNFLDVIVQGKEGMRGKIRQGFTIKVSK